MGIQESKAEEDWTFAGKDTRYMTHGFHMYPARMMPLIAKRLVRMFAPSSDDVVLDPFVGSGGVLVEARLFNRNSIGIDINPLAVIIAKAKATPIDPKILRKHGRTLFGEIEKDAVAKVNYGVPAIRNVAFWFKKSVIRNLNIIKHRLDELREIDQDVYNFFACAFSYTVRKTSNVRAREFKLYRIPEDELESYKPNALATFREIVDYNISKMHDFYRAVRDFDVNARVLEGNAKRLMEVDPEALHEGSASLVVTSPPYGDAHTTVAYGQFSRYPALWLGYDERKILNLDDTGLGGKPLDADVARLESPALAETYERVRQRDDTRAKELLAFFYDIDVCMKQIAASLKPGRSHCCFVLGNRTVKRVEVPADQILVELGRKYGYQHLATKYRDIPSKRIPWANAPENVSGQVAKTMAKESIIIWSL